MRRKLRTRRAEYDKRKITVEPVCGGDRALQDRGHRAAGAVVGGEDVELATLEWVW